jgi:hypothetical protein
LRADSRSTPNLSKKATPLSVNSPPSSHSVTWPRAHSASGFQHLRDARRRDPVVAVAALLDASNQSPLGEFAEMTACRLWRDAGDVDQFAAVSARPPISAPRMLARAGSPTSAATSAMRMSSLIACPPFWQHPPTHKM